MTYTPSEYLRKIKNLRTPEEIKNICQTLTKDLFNESDKPKTRINKLTPYNKEINSINSEELIEGENAYIQTKKDGSLWKRHLHYKYTGIADTNFNGEGGINTTTRVFDRSLDGHEVNVNQYLDVSVELLKSANVWEIVLGLIAVTGRRPAEILYRGEFKTASGVNDYLNKDYFVEFTGQIKKRNYGEPEYVYNIGVLVLAKDFIKKWKYYRASAEFKEVLKDVEAMTAQGKTEEDINAGIDDKYGRRLRRMMETKKYFGFLSPLENETNINPKTLRAVYSCLITKRDCPHKNLSGQMIWASQSLGHLEITDKTTDHDLFALVTSLGYSNYYPNTDHIPFTTLEGEKTVTLRAYQSELEEIKNLQAEWGCSTQQETLKRLLEEYNQLKAGHVEKPKTVRRPDNPEEIKGEDLFEKGIRFVGSAQEKVRRSYLAVTTYNDSVLENRLAITNQVLRQLSGSNGNDVSKWMKEHQDEIISHNAKYSMNTRENDLTTYYNKRYGAGKIEEIVEMIRQNYLQ